jgi:hypothetical protein
MIWISTFILFRHALDEGDLLRMQNIKEFVTQQNDVYYGSTEEVGLPSRITDFKLVSPLSNTYMIIARRY